MGAARADRGGLEVTLYHIPQRAWRLLKRAWYAPPNAIQSALQNRWHDLAERPIPSPEAPGEPPLDNDATMNLDCYPWLDSLRFRSPHQPAPQWARQIYRLIPRYGTNASHTKQHRKRDRTETHRMKPSEPPTMWTGPEAAQADADLRHYTTAQDSIEQARWYALRTEPPERRRWRDAPNLTSAATPKPIRHDIRGDGHPLSPQSRYPPSNTGRTAPGLYIDVRTRTHASTRRRSIDAEKIIAPPIPFRVKHRFLARLLGRFAPWPACQAPRDVVDPPQQPKADPWNPRIETAREHLEQLCRIQIENGLLDTQHYLAGPSFGRPLVHWYPALWLTALDSYRQRIGTA